MLIHSPAFIFLEFQAGFLYTGTDYPEK